MVRRRPPVPGTLPNIVAGSSNTGAGRPRPGAPLLAIAAALVAIYLLVTLLWPLALTIIVAGAAYYLLSPVVAVLERRGVPRLAGTTLAYTILIGGLVLVATIVVPRAYTQLIDVGRDLPRYAAEVERWLVAHDLSGDDADPRVRESVASLVERGDRLAVEAARSRRHLRDVEQHRDRDVFALNARQVVEERLRGAGETVHPSLLFPPTSTLAPKVSPRVLGR